MLQVTTNLYMFFILFYFFLSAVSLTILVCFWVVKVKFLRKWKCGKDFFSKLCGEIFLGVVVFAWNLFHIWHFTPTVPSSEPINGEVKRLTSDDCMPFNGPAFSIVGAHLSMIYDHSSVRPRNWWEMGWKFPNQMISFIQSVDSLPLSMACKLCFLFLLIDILANYQMASIVHP